MADYCENGYSFCTETVREHGLFLFDFIFQLVQALFHIRLALDFVMMRTTMLVVALMEVTVVDLMSILLIAQSANVWEKI